MKKNLKKFALNKKTISIINGNIINGGALPSNHANYGDYTDVHSDLVSLPVATNCPTDTFELSCICGGVNNDTVTPIDKEPAAPVRR